MQPIVVWQPLFHISPHESGAQLRDYQRALEQWQGQSVVYCLPELDERTNLFPKGVARPDAASLLIPSEEFNVFWVHHVGIAPPASDDAGETSENEGEQQYGIWPPVISTSTSRRMLPAGYYQEWLAASVQVHQCPETIRARRPVQVEGEWRLAKVEIPVTPSHPRPIVDVDADNCSAESLLPQTGPPPSPLLARGPEVEWVEPEEGIIKEPKSGAEGLALLFVWDSPFKALFPSNSGADLMWNRLKLEKHIQCLDPDSSEKTSPEETLRSAKTQLSPWAREGMTNYLQGVIMPHFAVRGDDIAWEYGSKAGVPTAQTMREVERGPEWNTLAREPVQCQMLLGWHSFFWWQFIQDLTDRIHLRCCKNCGMPIRGGQSNREFCNPKYEPEGQALACRRQRDRRRKREERDREKKAQEL